MSTLRIDLDTFSLSMYPAQAPSPTELLRAIADSKVPAFLMDWDGATLIGANAAFERHVDLPLIRLLGMSGRQLMAPACAAPLARWITKQLRETGEYRGPAALLRGEEQGPAVELNIFLLERAGFRYSVNLARPFEPRAREGRPGLLYVEDEPSLRRNMAKLLSHKYDVVTAATGLEALQWLGAEHHIQVVLTDLDMPDMDGVELIEVLRAVRLDLAERIVVLSGGNLNRCPPGITAVRKPAPIFRLLATLEETLG